MPSGEPLSKREKLRKRLAHRKLGVVVIPENRAIAWKKHRKYRIVKNSKMLAHKDKLWSRLWIKNRVAFRKNAAIKKFKQKIRWFTILPPGGGRSKPRKITICRTKNDKILLPFIQVKKNGTLEV